MYSLDTQMPFPELSNGISSAKAQLYDSIRSNYAQFQEVNIVCENRLRVHSCVFHLFIPMDVPLISHFTVEMVGLQPQPRSRSRTKISACCGRFPLKYHLDNCACANLSHGTRCKI